MRRLLPHPLLSAILLVIWLLLVNDVGLGPWLLALLVFAHGWVHLLFVFPKPQSPNDGDREAGYPFDFARSWLVTRRGFGLSLASRERTWKLAVQLPTTRSGTRSPSMSSINNL